MAMWRLVVLLLLAPALAAQEHSRGTTSPERLGTVHFQTSCSAAVQPVFNRAVALLHSFEFARATEAFDETLKADGSCTIADWGIALSRWGNPFAAGLKPASQAKLGLEAIAAAGARPPTTERERAYVAAAALLFTDYERIAQGDRVRAYRDAMAALSSKYPQDDEATIFYSLSLAAAADPADKTYASQLKSGALLEALLASHPDHPEMLMELKQPAQALTEFQATLKKEPNRFRSVYGAARAASLAGDRAAAHTYYGQLLKICERADSPGRPELAEARADVGSRDMPGG